MNRLVRALGVAAASATLMFAAGHGGVSGEAVAASPSLVEPALTLAEDRSIELAPGAAEAGTKTYIVQMALDPVVAYRGDIRGYPATRPAAGQKIDPNSAAVLRYKGLLDSRHDAALRAVRAPSAAKAYSYGYAFNGFAAELTESQVAALRKREDVVQVWEDELRELETNYTPDFLGLNDSPGGLVADLGLSGEDVIIGIIDSGIWPEHPSFSDRTGVSPTGKPGKLGYQQIPGWHGRCVPGQEFNASLCNQKLIGAQYFGTGFFAGGPLADGEFVSPRDATGHGTHVASTAGGNAGVQPHINGVVTGEPISGMAPRARIASYKACWVRPNAVNASCNTSDLQAAIDQAVADGVDIINYSIGSNAPGLLGPDAIAFLFAADAGVFVATSVGNAGPGPATAGSPGGVPWLTSVGASTRDGQKTVLALSVDAPASVAGDYPALEGAITKSLKETGTVSGDLVAADPILACTPLNNDLSGKIALIERGDCTFVVKVEHAVDAGAIAVVVYTSAAAPKTIMGGDATDKTLSVPGVMIDNAPGVAIAAAIGGGEGSVSFGAQTLTEETTVGNVMASFSSRSPNRSALDIIKPDVTAPGVDILAASSPSQATSGGVQGELFEYKQGTSMSSPHVAGIAALIKEARPHWSPAAIRSALMTTARQDVVKENGSTPADPFDYGAGHVVPNSALEPGLVYEAGLLDYFGFLCEAAPQAFANPAALCAALDSLGIPTEAASLNYPSIGVAEMVGERTVTRRVTNVAATTSTYAVSVEAPAGVDVVVDPPLFTINPGESVVYSVTFSANADVQPNNWAFGALTWSDGIHEVYSPIAVRPLSVKAPAELVLEGTAGSTEIEVQFGFAGTYTAGAHGLAAPLRIPGTVEDDPNNSFVFLGPGTHLTLLNLPAGLAFFRTALFNEYTDGDDDLDLYVYYCPGGLCSLRGSSGNPDSNERVSIVAPEAGLWAIFVHGWETDGPDANFELFNWALSATPGSPNLTVNGESVSADVPATLGGTTVLDVAWSGLPEDNKFLGAISHSGPGGLEGLTILGVSTD
jgi:subtilisin family serine protease